MTRFDSLVLAATTLVAGSTAQQLATFDPAAAPLQEFASVACAPAPAIGTVDDLVSPPPALGWFHGAIAAANYTQELYYATGNPAHGILRVPFTDIGTGAAPVMYASPPGFNQLTGMVVDPRVSAGDTLFVSDGFVIGLYDVTLGIFLAPPQPAPVAPGQLVTGLGYDPFTNRIFVVDDASTIRSRSLAGGPWSAPIVPAVAVPVQPTGIAFCKTAPGTPFVSYWNGIVMAPATGMMMPFPGAPAGIRHHRGLTFMGKAVKITALPPPWHPEVEIRNGFYSGNPNTQVQVDNPGGIALLAVDFAPTFPVGAPVLGFGGLILLNPNSSLLLGFYGVGTSTLALSLVGVPPGIGLTFQAANLAGAQGALSDAVYMRTHL